jgi:hypothetical protein
MMGKTTGRLSNGAVLESLEDTGQFSLVYASHGENKQTFVVFHLN